ncbi:MAG: hypothetical protein ACK58L_14160 [Planctomycetota bacterium]
MNSSSVFDVIKSGSRVKFWGADERADRESSVARYSRVAMVEAVLSIRERRQRSARIFAASAFMVLGVVVLAAGILGWL